MPSPARVTLIVRRTINQLKELVIDLPDTSSEDDAENQAVAILESRTSALEAEPLDSPDWEVDSIDVDHEETTEVLRNEDEEEEVDDLGDEEEDE